MIIILWHTWQFYLAWPRVGPEGLIAFDFSWNNRVRAFINGFKLHLDLNSIQNIYICNNRRSGSGFERRQHNHSTHIGVGSNLRRPYDQGKWCHKANKKTSNLFKRLPSLWSFNTSKYHTSANSQRILISQIANESSFQFCLLLFHAS